MSRTSASAPETAAGEAEAEVARWLVEVGRRRLAVRPRCGASAAPPSPSADSSLYRVVLVGALAAALFQYLYFDVLLEIASLRSLIVFVLSGGHG